MASNILLFIVSLIFLHIKSIKSWNLSKNYSNEIKYKGITFVGDKYCPEISYEDPRSLSSLKKLKETGANWVAIVVTEYQDYVNSTDIYPLYNDYITNEYYIYKTESINGLINVINYAHSIGLNVMLKPHIDLSKESRYNETWRGNIGQNFTNQYQWKKWFKSYKNFIIKYAELAEILHVEMFSLSCELIATSKMDIFWRSVIKKIRKVYSGLLIDSANHDGEEYNKTWWDAVDLIGIDAYYMPIQTNSLYELEKHFESEMQITLQKIKILSKKFKKNVIITEIGFCSGNCLIGNRNFPPTLTDQYIQAYFYESFLKMFYNQKHVQGFFWWAWNSDPYYGGSNDNCISPQHKMSEYVLRNYYGGNLTSINYVPEGNATCLCTI